MDRLAESGVVSLDPVKAAVVTSSLDGIVMIDEAGRLLAMNPAAEAMFGWSREEAEGRAIAELIVPEAHREAHRQGLSAYLAGGKPKILGKRIETTGLCRDGRVIPIELTVLEVVEGGRRIFTATIRDRTGPAAREAELELTRRRFELAVDGADLGVWSFDWRDGSAWFSDRARDILGLDVNFLEDARALERHIHPDDWHRLVSPYYEGFPDEPIAIEYRVVRPDGSLRWVSALGAAVPGPDGTTRAVHGINFDITERKEAEENLARSQRHLALAIEGADLGVWTFDPATAAIWYSERSRQMFGLSPGDPLDIESLQAMVHPDDWERLSAPYYRGFPDDPVALEYRVRLPNNETRWIYALGAAARDEQGKAITVHGIHLDVTDRKRAEEELARSRNALVQSEKLVALGALLAGVSHELNNPLAAIVGQAEMMAEDCEGTPLAERAKRIGAAAERCARIVQTFLAMARQREKKTERIAINEVISSALELTEYSLRTTGVAVRVNFGNLPPVEGDRDQLHQVLVNLIVNAQQAMEKGETFEKVLTIRTSIDQAGRVLVDVTDTGPGVPEKVRHRIFEPFFTTRRQKRGGGTGIGLSFSQGIVVAHGGTISVEPSRRGAHFRIELPAVPGEAILVEPRELEIAVPDLAGSRRRCLVVEDEPDVAETLRELIEREGFDVTLAANGTEAFFALDKGDFDLLFSDLRMPLLNGAELHERLTEIRPDLVKRMAFVTGDTMGDSMGEFARNCGRPILEKPFTRAGVRAVLAALVDPE